MHHVYKINDYLYDFRGCNMFDSCTAEEVLKTINMLSTVPPAIFLCVAYNRSQRGNSKLSATFNKMCNDLLTYGTVLSTSPKGNPSYEGNRIIETCLFFPDASTFTHAAPADVREPTLLNQTHCCGVEYTSIPLNSIVGYIESRWSRWSAYLYKIHIGKQPKWQNRFGWAAMVTKPSSVEELIVTKKQLESLGVAEMEYEEVGDGLAIGLIRESYTGVVEYLKNTGQYEEILKKGKKTDKITNMFVLF